MCGRNGCDGIMHRHRLDYTPNPLPRRTLKCDKCGHVVMVFDEPGKPFAEVWLIDQGQEESLRDFLDRTYAGKGGPIGFLV